MYQRVALGSSKEKTEHEAKHTPPVGAHFRVRIDQSKPCNVDPIFQLGNLEAQRVAR